jgi:L,D-transpeptidase-like protein
VGVNWAGAVLLVSLGTSSSQPAPAGPPVRVEYRLDPLPKDVKELDRLFTPPQIALLEKLNRRDREHLPRPDPPIPGLVVPHAWPPNELDVSPLPLEYLWARAISKTVVVHQPVQAFGAYEFGRLVRWGPVSTGRKETPTPVGLFHLTWKAKERRSTDNEQWLLRWYFNFVNSRGVSFHQFDLPGYPASHACVRMLERDAEWLYSWGDQWKLDPDGRRITATGSVVLIVGTPAARPPWTDVGSLGAPVELPPLPIWLLIPVGFTGT